MIVAIDVHQTSFAPESQSVFAAFGYEIKDEGYGRSECCLMNGEGKKDLRTRGYLQMSLPLRMTSALKPRQPETFMIGAVIGMTSVTGICNCWPWKAIASAWLPKKIEKPKVTEERDAIEVPPIIED